MELGQLAAWEVQLDEVVAVTVAAEVRPAATRRPFRRDQDFGFFASKM